VNDSRAEEGEEVMVRVTATPLTGVTYIAFAGPELRPLAAEFAAQFEGAEQDGEQRVRFAVREKDWAVVKVAADWLRGHGIEPVADSHVAKWLAIEPDAKGDT
jgi:hypothetical protein